MDDEFALFLCIAIAVACAIFVGVWLAYVLI